MLIPEEQFRGIEQAARLYPQEVLEQMNQMTKVLKPLIQAHDLKLPPIPEQTLNALTAAVAHVPMMDVNQKAFWEKQAEIIRNVDKALANMPVGLQEAFWSTPLDDGFFDLVTIALDAEITEEQRRAKLSTLLEDNEDKSSWLQIRRELYPVVKNISNVESVLLSAFANLLEDSALYYVYIAVLIVLIIIHRLGDPDEEKPTRTNK